jgi:hypothetical protein
LIIAARWLVRRLFFEGLAILDDNRFSLIPAGPVKWSPSPAAAIVCGPSIAEPP